MDIVSLTEKITNEEVLGNEESLKLDNGSFHVDGVGIELVLS